MIAIKLPLVQFQAARSQARCIEWKALEITWQLMALSSLSALLVGG